jgi:quercetin dioxygenase-like cupin family protein
MSDTVQQAPGIKRTDLQEHDLSVPGRMVIQNRVQLGPEAPSVRHKHPGEEIIYVLEGSLEYGIDGSEPKTYHAGEALMVPAETVHSVRNVGGGEAAELATYVVERASRSSSSSSDRDADDPGSAMTMGSPGVLRDYRGGSMCHRGASPRRLVIVLHAACVVLGPRDLPGARRPPWRRLLPIPSRYGGRHSNPRWTNEPRTARPDRADHSIRQCPMGVDGEPRGRGRARPPAALQDGDGRRRRAVAVADAREGLAAAPVRVGARPIAVGRQAAVALAPGEHRLAPTLAGSFRLDHPSATCLSRIPPEASEGAYRLPFDIGAART